MKTEDWIMLDTIPSLHAFVPKGPCRGGRRGSKTRWPRTDTYVSALLVSVLLLVSPAAAAPTAVINNITLPTPMMSCCCTPACRGPTPRTKQAILSGTTTSVVFIILLKQGRFLWLDDKIADINVVHSIAYDKVKKEFVVRRSWRNNEPEVTPSFEEAQMLESRIESLKIIPLSRIAKGSQYQLHIKAEASRKTLPLGLNTVLFFMSFWDVQPTGTSSTSPTDDGLFHP